ncbi:MAG TPA: hypothetical protein VLS85_14490, partial [Hanamia sp.]|nr:hypothetical protein [Hanamia sp.]
MNLHLSSYYSFSSEAKDDTSGKRPFQTFFPVKVNPAFYRLMLFVFSLVMASLSAFSQVTPSVNITHLNTRGGGIMYYIGGGGGGGSTSTCSFTTNLSTTPYTVTVGGTPPTLTVVITNVTG